MKMYEGFFILPPESGPDARKEELKFLEDSIQKVKGTLVEKVEWGKKSLGYAVKRNREGYIVILRIQLDPAGVQELRHAFTLEERILKFMITVQKPPVDRKAGKKAAPSSAGKVVQQTASA